MTENVLIEPVHLDHPVFQELLGVLRRVADKAVVFGCGRSGNADSVRFVILRVSRQDGERAVKLIHLAIKNIGNVADQPVWSINFKAWPEFTQITIERKNLVLWLPQISLCIQLEVEAQQSVLTDASGAAEQ